MMTSGVTPARKRFPRLADPKRFRALQAGTSRSVILLFGGSLVLGGMLAAVPREIPGFALATIVGGAWLSLVLAMTLPSRAERAGNELSRRLGQFRHELNVIGDRPTSYQLDQLLDRAQELELRTEEIEPELTQIHASKQAIDLADQLALNGLPVVQTSEPLAPGDRCHLLTPVRFGRRRSDQFGHLMLTSGWIKFRGPSDLSVAWDEVDDIQRADREVIVSLRDSRRTLRFSCHGVNEAARVGVLAQHLVKRSGPRHIPTDNPAPYQAAV